MPDLELTEGAIGFLELVQEQNARKLFALKELIINAMIDAGLKSKVEGLPFSAVVAILQENVSELGRRLATEAYTGITSFDKTMKSFEYREAGIEKYVYVGPADDKTRDACLDTLSDPRQETGWTREEIAESQTPFITTGGYNCRHEWHAFVDELKEKPLGGEKVDELKEARKERQKELAAQQRAKQ